MKILVTGGAGFIGSNFIRHVLSVEKNCVVVNYDKLTYAGNLANLDSLAENLGYRFVKGDICDAAAVEAAIRSCGAAVHFAAESHVDRGISPPPPHIQPNPPLIPSRTNSTATGCMAKRPAGEFWPPSRKPKSARSTVPAGCTSRQP